MLTDSESDCRIIFISSLVKAACTVRLVRAGLSFMTALVMTARECLDLSGAKKFQLNGIPISLILSSFKLPDSFSASFSSETSSN